MLLGGNREVKGRQERGRCYVYRQHAEAGVACNASDYHVVTSRARNISRFFVRYLLVSLAGVSSFVFQVKEYSCFPPWLSRCRRERRRLGAVLGPSPMLSLAPGTNWQRTKIPQLRTAKAVWLRWWWLLVHEQSNSWRASLRPGSACTLLASSHAHTR